ncbi:MAG: TIGR03960 family B12-binding radical SAM protein [Candidatus Omnitrophota bacterium]
MNLEELLLTVQKPGRYCGGEWNSVRKEWTDDKVKVLLAFPDLYEVGMSYLGTKILYGILNDRDDCLCERVFSPWGDFEDVLRKNNLDLFSLETRRPIKDFDIIGFSVTYELGYTNVLNMLDLGRIPLRAPERTDEDPLIIAGGPSCYNPEPIAEFIDAFVIGDGEEVISEIVDAYKAGESRKELLTRLSKIKGIYVPSFYNTEYNEDGTPKKFSIIEKDAPAKIIKRFVGNLDDAYYPVKQIVPNIQIIHDRLIIEIMRGCKHGCKFCQATVTYRPCRERSVGKILELARESYARTGYDEISLLSLSSVDHSRLPEIMARLNEEFGPRSVSISVPSLRIEDALKNLPLLISNVKKAGLTFAPEAGTPELRKSLNKGIDIEKLFHAALESYKAGWRHVKLYFMIGLPGETEKDLLSISEMIYKISDLKREVDGKSAHITASINAFVPKPHTPFQREPMDSAAILNKKIDLLRKSMRSKMVEMDFHSVKMSYLEAVFSRGDRALAAVVYEAWKSGARFDGWKDRFNFDLWMAAFEKAGVDHSFYAGRARLSDEILPWDFIIITS